MSGLDKKKLDEYLTRSDVDQQDWDDPPRCEGCGKPLGLIEAQRWHVCFACTKARAAAVANHGRCVCRRTQRKPRVVVTRSRTWVACDRCLGTISTLDSL